MVVHDELLALLEKVEFGPDDRVVSVGDLVASQVPRAAKFSELFMSDARFSSVIGNHDLALRRRWNGEDVDFEASAKRGAQGTQSGGRTHYASYFNRLPFVIDLDTHLVVHAGLRPNVELHSQTTGI